MRIPKRLQPLIEEGLIDEVVRPITAGKEAEVFVVWASGALRAAKVYKEANQRSFKNRADYLDGRKSRGSRDERALKRGGKFAKEAEEEGWYTAELLALGRLHAAGVRVPEPRAFMDGVLIMDLVLTLEGEPAPRLADCNFTADEARLLYGELVHEVQRMLCAGIVHGDLSEYNVLLAPYGPVIIDFPQMVDAAASLGARKLLLRDLGNLRTFAGRFAPELLDTRYGEEMWLMYQSATLTPDTVLTGKWKDSTRAANVDGVREAISDAEKDHLRQSARAPRTSGGPQGRPAGRGGPPRGQAPRGPAQGPSEATSAGLKTHPRGSVSEAPRAAPPQLKTHPRGSVSEAPRPASPPANDTRPARPHHDGPRPHHDGPRPPRSGQPQQGPPPQRDGPRPQQARARSRVPRARRSHRAPRPPQGAPHHGGPRSEPGAPNHTGPRPASNAGPHTPKPRPSDPRGPRTPHPSDARDTAPREPRR